MRTRCTSFRIAFTFTTYCAWAMLQGAILLSLSSCTKAKLIDSPIELRVLASALTLSPSTSTRVVGSSFTFSSTGGLPPYQYSVLTGGGTIDATTGAYTAPTTPGSVTLRVTDLAGATSDATVTVQAGPTAQFLLIGAPTTIAGNCEPYTITRLDTYGNIPNPASALAVSLGGNGSGTFYSDSACSSSISTVTIPAGTDTETFYFRDTLAQSVTLSATAGALSATRPVTIGAGPASKLAVTGPASVVAAGCSSAYTVTSTDAYGNASPVAADTTVSLSGAGAGTFYASSGCSGNTSSLTLSNGTSTTPFYFKDSSSEALTLTADATGLTTGSRTVKIQTKLVISGSATVAAGSCGTVTITSEDATNAVMPVAVTTTFQLYNATYSSTYETYYSDSSCTTPMGSFNYSGTLTMAAGATTLNTYFKITRAAATNFQLASISSLSTNGPTFNFTVTPDTANTLVVTGPSFVQPNACSAAYLLTAKDSYGNISTVASDQTVTLTTTGTGAFYSDSLCTVAVPTVTITTGTSSASFYYMDSPPGFYTLTTSSPAGFTGGSFLVDITSVAPMIIGAAGGAHTCAIVNGAVKCWGRQTGGCLGNNSAASSLVPVQAIGITSGATAIVAESTASPHACAIVNGAALCWGQNASGEVGVGNSTPVLTPTQVIGLTSGVTDIATTNQNTCAVVNGAAWCWGYNASGQLGNNSTVNSSVPVQVQGLSSGVTSIAIGQYHSCAVVSGGVQCWGSNAYGELGTGNNLASLVPVQVQGLTSGATAVVVGNAFSCALVSGGAQCWGIGTGNVPVTVGGLSSSVSSIVMTHQKACVVDQGAAKCWGISGTPTASVAAGLSSGVLQVSMGGDNNGIYSQCAVTVDGLKCWGYNYAGQLGDSSYTDSLTTAVPVQSLN